MQSYNLEVTTQTGAVQRVDSIAKAAALCSGGRQEIRSIDALCNDGIELQALLRHHARTLDALCLMSLLFGGQLFDLPPTTFQSLTILGIRCAVIPMDRLTGRNFPVLTTLNISDANLFNSDSFTFDEFLEFLTSLPALQNLKMDKSIGIVNMARLPAQDYECPPNIRQVTIIDDHDRIGPFLRHFPLRPYVSLNVSAAYHSVPAEAFSVCSLFPTGPHSPDSLLNTAFLRIDADCGLNIIASIPGDWNSSIDVIIPSQNPLEEWGISTPRAFERTPLKVRRALLNDVIRTIPHYFARQRDGASLKEIEVIGDADAASGQTWYYVLDKTTDLHTIRVTDTQNDGPTGLLEAIALGKPTNLRSLVIDGLEYSEELVEAIAKALGKRSSRGACKLDKVELHFHYPTPGMPAGLVGHALWKVQDSTDAIVELSVVPM